MKHHVFVALFLFIFISFLTVPSGEAQAMTYEIDLSQFSTTQEKITHLRGILVILQAQLAEKLAGENNGVTTSGTRNFLSVTTLTARDVRDSKAEMRGRFDIDDEDFVTAWFEFGTTREMYERTVKARIEGDQDENRIFLHQASGLKDDTTYYYRLVVENERGVRSFGSIRSFKTLDEDSASTIVVRDRSIEVGDTIVFDWHIPQTSVNSKNWVAIYREGEQHTDPERWIRARSATGSISLKITQRGNYEARFFERDTYNVIAVSELVDVSN